MQNFGFKPNFTMNDIRNKNILMPNFNYNYNFNIGQMKQMDQNKIDLCKNSVSIIDKLQNIYPNNSVTANEIYNIYNMSLNNLRESSKNNKLEDITKKAQFYFNLYNIINKKKCQHIENNVYKCSFLTTNLPNQSNNKKIQININNNLFNGAIINNGFYSFQNRNGFVNSNYNNNSFSQNSSKSSITIDDDDKLNKGTKSKKMVNKDNEKGLLGKKRNLDDKAINGEHNDKKKKLENNNKNLKSKKGESPMLEINKNQLKSVQKLKKNDRKNNRDKKHRNKKDYNRMNNRKIQEETEAKFSWEKVSEKEEEEKFMNFEKDLKDYLRRTISANRQNEFFSNVIPESLDIVKNLFQKNSNLQVNKLYPIYRNDKFELSLIIEPGGKIRKQLTNFNI